ncbi:hypothetical protein GCM10025789_20250 [Tessaracoccus lubricantis]|uniref:Uncharacterized protein n=1 Tax=Tessaracoccus lubricantis TaxID=545543 RepID=A0ABP9FGK8_9ACTN
MGEEEGEGRLDEGGASFLWGHGGSAGHGASVVSEDSLSKALASLARTCSETIPCHRLPAGEGIVPVRSVTRARSLSPPRSGMTPVIYWLEPP